MEHNKEIEKMKRKKKGAGGMYTSSIYDKKN